MYRMSHLDALGLQFGITEIKLRFTCVVWFFYKIVIGTLLELSEIDTGLYPLGRLIASLCLRDKLLAGC